MIRNYVRNLKGKNLEFIVRKPIWSRTQAFENQGLTVSNYRPISLLTTLSKILEKLIKGRLVKFFDKHNILYEYQHDFREKHSVSLALLDVSSLRYDSIQNKLHTAMLFMDPQKAFDKVSHKIWPHKLYHYEIRGPALSLITSCFSSRKQYVSVNNVSNSSPLNLEYNATWNCKTFAIGATQTNCK